MQNAKRRNAGPTLDPSNMPEALGWRRRPNLDEPSREAWELRDGTCLLLDPSGQSDSLVRPAHSSEVTEAGGILAVGPAEPAEPAC